ncbi:MAG: carboxypeptidase regulatory-like domain-containing protein, partial [Planctomycetes bacterium]|nr:carboxypeptidase regulatory-like domain-containing protein [Planctomycetota bacterium]
MTTKWMAIGLFCLVTAGPSVALANPLDEAGAVITGRVLTDEGAPIVGARVEAFRELIARDASLTERLSALQNLELIAPDAERAATTDAGGRYRLVDLPPCDLSLRVSAVGRAHQTRRYVRAGATDVDFELEKGATLTGVVRSAEGERAPGAAVYLYPGEDPNGSIVVTALDHFRPPLASAWAQPDGAYRFDILRVGARYRLLVTAPTFQPAEQEFEAEHSTMVDITLAPGKVLVGRVTAPDGAPIAGARVRVAGFGRGSCEPALPIEDRFTDEGGRFRFDTLGEGEHRLVVSHEDFATFTRQQVEPNGVEIAIELTEGATIQGMVRDSVTGVP